MKSMFFGGWTLCSLVVGHCSEGTSYLRLRGGRWTQQDPWNYLLYYPENSELLGFWTLPIVRNSLKKKDLWSESNYTDKATSACRWKLVPTFADRGCRMVSAMDPHSRILSSLDRSCNYFFQLAPQLYSRGWVDPVPGPLLLRKSDNAGNQTRTSDH
jgi:hypothetical protein